MKIDIEFFEKYKLNSKIEIKNYSEKFVTGIISHAKFDEIKKIENTEAQTIWFRSSPCFVDPRSHKLGVRILSSLDKLYLTVKKLSLKRLQFTTAVARVIGSLVMAGITRPGISRF